MKITTVFSLRAVQKLLCAAIVFLLPLFTVKAQDYWSDDYGDSNTADSFAGKIGLTMGGEITGEMLLFPYDIVHNVNGYEWGNIVSAKLNFGASTRNAEAVLNFKLSPQTIQGTASGDLFQTPMIIDEAYLRAFFGPVTLETGFRKLAWGRADIQGPLDVTNPLDYTDLTNVELMGRKIARPMIHASLSLGSASKLEGVFIPSFQGHRYSTDTGDRWFPAVIATGRGDLMKEGIASRIVIPAIAAMVKNIPFDNFADLLPGNTNGLEYAQGGLRFSTTAGPADIGAQYYSGFLSRPSMVIDGANEFIAQANLGFPNPALLSPRMRYNRYHQIGVDYAQVLFGLSVRAELAANITEDLAGDDGGVYNPSLAWSLGFDRDIFGFTLLVEADESIRLLNDKVGNNPATDTEAGLALTTTAITVQLSRSFLQDNLEIKFTALWNVENSDIYLMPSLSYTMGDLKAVLAGGIFAGKDGGELSQYRNNGYIKTGLTYSF
jgi:hypothetical protein